MSATTRTEEYGGHTVEASVVGETWYVTVDGVECKRTFASSAHALDHGKAKVRAARKAENRPTVDVERCPVPSHSPWAVRKFGAPRDLVSCGHSHGSDVR